MVLFDLIDFYYARDMSRQLNWFEYSASVPKIFLFKFVKDGFHPNYGLRIDFLIQS